MSLDVIICWYFSILCSCNNSCSYLKKHSLFSLDVSFLFILLLYYICIKYLRAVKPINMDLQNNSKSEHYNLRWNNYTANLIQVFSEHQYHETLVDVTLTCEGQFVKAHKLILSACSGFFEDMFKIHSTVQHPFIILNGIKVNHLKHILEFIYHGEVKILDEDLEGVLALGESFQVKGLSSVKIKRQTPLPEQEPSRSNSAPVNVINSNKNVPNILTNQQKENIRDAPRSQEKSKEPLSRSIKTVLGSDTHMPEGIQNTLEVQNGREIAEPAAKRTKIPVVCPVTSVTNTNNEVSAMETIPKEPEGCVKIPRPTNAFMIFANEWRKKLAVEHPKENNKAISVRLGNMWKSLSTETKESYYLAAKKAQEEHQLKYPGYTYNPQEARKRKAVRRKTIDCATAMSYLHTEIQEEDDGDLEVIEIEEDPTVVSDNLKSTHF